MDKIVAFDIETNGLYAEANTIHCLALKVNDEPTQLFTADNMEAGIDILASADLLVGHNIINYDLPVLKKLGYTLNNSTHDTLIHSRLACPDLLMKDAKRKSVPPKLKGSHSLKAWGFRLRKLKGDFSEEADWSKYTSAMGEYCKQDVEVTHALYQKLLTYDTPAKAMQMEQAFAKLISRQEKHGVYFDTNKAKDLHITLLQEAERLEGELAQTFKPLETWVVKSYPKAPHKKDGSKSSTLLRQEALGYVHNNKGEWGYTELRSFKPTSRQDIARWLREVYGWKPKVFTEKGSVVVNEAVLSELEFAEGKLLASYFQVKKLIGMLAEGNNAWLKLVDDDNRLRGSVNTLGAVSRRCTHARPNLAQVPSARAYMGKEVRSLFTVPRGKKIVGCDMSGLELRVFAHYLARYDGGAYADVILTGDIHTFNQTAAGLETRDQAKTFCYALLYGAGDEKIGEIVNKGATEGRKLKERFFKALPAYKSLLRDVAKTYKAKGTLKALDGNPYHIRSEHSALNTLLQGAGALLCKIWAVLADRALRTAGYTSGTDYEFVLSVHDEVQIECNEGIAEDVAEIVKATANKAGDIYKMRIRIDADANIGNNWSETH